MTDPIAHMFAREAVLLRSFIDEAWQELAGPDGLRLEAEVYGPVSGRYGDAGSAERRIREMADAIADSLYGIDVEGGEVDRWYDRTVRCEYSDGSVDGVARIRWAKLLSNGRTTRFRSMRSVPRIRLEVMNVRLPYSDDEDGPLTPGDIEVLVADLPPERVDALREWIEPLVGQLVRAIEQGRFEDGSPQLRGAELNRDVLRHQLWESDSDDFRPAMVVQHVYSVIEALTAGSDDPAAELAKRIASAPTGTSYGPDDAIAQRDAIADQTGLPPTDVDKALFGTNEGLGIIGAVTSIYAAYEAGTEVGVLLGAAVAVVYLFTKAIMQR